MKKTSKIKPKTESLRLKKKLQEKQKQKTCPIYVLNHNKISKIMHRTKARLPHP